MLGLSLLLALLFSHRLRQPHHLWAGCHVVVLLLLLAHMGIFSIGIIGAMPIRHSRWRKKRCYEKSIRLMTAFFKSFDVASHAAARRRGLGTNRRIEHLAKRISPFDIAGGTEKIWLVLAIDRLNRSAVGTFASGLLAILYRQSNIGISSYKTIHYWTY